MSTTGYSGRIEALDGLRGVAALIVVFHHLSLTLPAFADVYLASGAAPAAAGSPLWWFTAGPGQLLVAGPEAVLIFFVLSGCVVALPTLRSATFDWIAYYPRRVIRLYLPVIGAVLFAAAMILISHQRPTPGGSLWVAGSSTPQLVWQQVLSATDVLFGDTSIDNPLWSLRWEVVFSLALPLFLLIAVAAKRHAWIVIIACIILTWVGAVSGSGSFLYLPAFLAGTVLAVHVDTIRDWLAKPSRARWAVPGGALVLLLSVGLLNLHWEVWGLRPGDGWLQTIARAPATLGALGLVFLAIYWRPGEWLLSTPVFRWLGRVSFSLYLVHVPIIVAAHSVLGPGRALLVAGISFIASLVVAELFARFVELPSHRLARSVGRRASAMMKATAANG